MVWNRMIERLLRRRTERPSALRSRRRRLRHESLVKRNLLAADIGAITGVSYSDLTGDGLTVDDPRLEGVTVELYRDTNTNGSFDSGVDALVATDTTDTSADPVPGQYRFDDLSADTYFVVQSAASASISAPAAQTVVITADDADGESLVTIDDFTSGAQTILATGGSTLTNSTGAPAALGGSRDVELIHTNGAGNTTFQVDTSSELLSLSTGGGATAQATVEYDGIDNSFGLNVPPGFSPIASLAGGTAGGVVPTNTGLELLARAENQDETMIVTVITSATEASEISVTVPQNASLQSIFREFSDPGWTTSSLAGVTGPADFNSIIAIRAEAAVTLADNDIFFSVVESRGPAPVTSDLANEQLLTLGGTVFNDFGGGADTNDGELDGAELGINGVTVQLFGEPGGGGTIDPSTQSPVATTTTDANGDYSFDLLSAGNYLVVIPDSEFAGGASLFGFETSTGNDPAPDPDDDVDSDDNGTESAGVGLVTAEITLAPGTEPTTDGDADDNTNFSVDFGVIPTIDLEVTKTLDVASSNVQAGGTAVFDILFTNNGPLDATNVVVTDVLPAGLTIDQANSNFGTFTPTINGQTLTLDVGTLAANTAGSIVLATTVDAAQTGDVTNTASITGDQVDTNTSNNSEDEVVDLIDTDLTITKDDNTTGSVVAGEQFTYTITVTNNGPDDATGVTASDTLPSDLSFVSGTFTTGTGTVTENPAGSGDLTIDIGALANGASAVIDIVVAVASDAGTSISNTATVTNSPDTDSNTANDSAQEDTPVVRNVDVGVTKTVTGTAIAGGMLTYTIEVSNAGPGDARDVVVTDTLDAAYTFNSFDAGTSGVSISQNGQDLTFDVGTLTSGQTETFTFVVDITSSASGTIDNTADIATSDTDTNTANDSSTVQVAIGTEVDLILTKVVDLTTAVPGQDTLTYTFTIGHDTDSISDSGQVTFTDSLPAGTTGVTIDAPDATSSSFDSAMQTVTIIYDTIAVGVTRTFTVTASVNEDATGTLDNTGTITVAGGELDTTNNTDTASTTLTPEFDVTIDKTVDDATPAPGANVTYSVELTNSGPSTATNVVLSDDVPAGLTFVSGTLDGNAASLGSGVVTFPAISLDSGETQTATLIFTLGADESGTITNTASVTADSGETDTTNNSDTQDITATPDADLSVQKTVDDATHQAGDTLTYTITVTNNGPSTAVAATAVDTLPSGVTFVSGVGPNGETLTANSGVVTVDGGDLASGADFTFTITATVDSGASGTLTNSVTVSTTTADSDSTNDTATVDIEADPVSSSISGVVYVDADNDGIQDVGEVGIEGVTITLTGTDGEGNSVSRTVTTDANGAYSFDALAQGTYQVEQTQPNNFRDGQETLGTGATANVGDDVFTNLDLGVDTDAVDFLFGELRTRLSKRDCLTSYR